MFRLLVLKKRTLHSTTPQTQPRHKAHSATRSTQSHSDDTQRERERETAHAASRATGTYGLLDEAGHGTRTTGERTRTGTHDNAWKQRTGERREMEGQEERVRLRETQGNARKHRTQQDEEKTVTDQHGHGCRKRRRPPERRQQRERCVRLLRQ